MNGILCIDKPPEHTSFDVVARMRGIAGTRKIGHGGTLDPMATGVLPLFFGRATKAADLMPDQDKTYAATFRLGITTDTQDITGTVLERRPVTAGKQQVEEALRCFTGPQLQTPPMYSAVQVNGQRLYDLARQGIEVERPAREITVYSLTLLDWNEEAHEYTVEATCSKGTYIRTLCHEIGRELGCGATLTALRRVRACGYTLAQCITLEEAQALAAANALAAALLPVETAFAGLPRLVLNEKLSRLFRNGVALSLNQFDRQITGQTAIFAADGAFLGLGEPDAEGARLRILKLFHPD